MTLTSAPDSKIRPRLSGELRDYIRRERDRIIRERLPKLMRIERDLERLIERYASEPTPYKRRIEQLRPRGIGSPWTREGIIEAILLWREEHGRWPTSVVWEDTRAIPTARTIIRYFGSWSAALEAAKLEAARREAGQGSHLPPPGVERRAA